jgi:hypothetical protein
VLLLSASLSHATMSRTIAFVGIGGILSRLAAKCADQTRVDAACVLAPSYRPLTFTNDAGGL